MDKFLCIHGHFYQPPRENPWLEAVELQDSAYPYHDWNQRITAECYGPNAHARILDGEGYITAIRDNYAQISFNFGPTLLSWLEQFDPQLYAGLQAADRESQQRFAGHGSALAQGYNHMILPLANPRDLRTQVEWGIRDFEHRFGRAPEGMWLPETAANLATLEALAAAGVAFTILAPAQARRVRKRGTRNWTDVSGGRIDPSRPYWAMLPSGRQLALFFYDGPIARAVAFEGLLTDGGVFAQRLLSGFSAERTGPQLMHIATDGESYGHHHRFGEMALAYALEQIAANKAANIVNYGAFLAAHPPEEEADIWENSSWSCVHGIERWRSDCGCNSGGHPGWNQRWRAPLREALDWLRDQLAILFESELGKLLHDPWAARDDYIGVVLDRSTATAFLARRARAQLDAAEVTRALELLEMQRHAMLMYTSCGWFFDDLTGIETVQVLQYAGRALQLAETLAGGHELEQGFLQRLEKALSNVPERGNGRKVFEESVHPARVYLTQVGAHYAVSSLFEEYSDTATIYCYTISREDSQMAQGGRMRFARGRIRVQSNITLEAETFTYAVLHLGDHNLSGGVRPYQGEGPYTAMNAQLDQAFAQADIAELLHGIDRDFGPSAELNGGGGGTYSLRLLFRDEQRKILNRVLESSRSQSEAAYRELYDENAPLLRFLHTLHIPAPRHLEVAAEETLRQQMFQVVDTHPFDRERLRLLAQEARDIGLDLKPAQDLGLAMGRTLERLAREVQAEPDQLESIEALEKAVRLAREVPFQVEMAATQDIFFALLPVYRAKRAESGGAALAWANCFERLGRDLKMRIPLAPEVSDAIVQSVRS